MLRDLITYTLLLILLLAWVQDEGFTVRLNGKAYSVKIGS